MGTCAKVNEITLLVEGDLLSLGNTVYKKHLVRLALLLHELQHIAGHGQDLLSGVVAVGGVGAVAQVQNILVGQQLLNLAGHAEAADAGVEIDLIVRGVCCYRPKPKQDNLRVFSIVDRFLEHTRIFYFGNMGDPEYYLSSADWMTRNLDRRVETLFPVTDNESRSIISNLLKFQLEDEDKKRKLLPTGVYTRPRVTEYSSRRSQTESYRFLKELHAGLAGGREETLKVFASWQALKKLEDDPSTPTIIKTIWGKGYRFV